MMEDMGESKSRKLEYKMLVLKISEDVSKISSYSTKSSTLRARDKVKKIKLFYFLSCTQETLVTLRTTKSHP